MSDRVSDLLQSYLTLIRRSVAVPSGILSTVAVSVLTDSLPKRDPRPCAVILSPHPDDECLTGALPLRLQREKGWQIINIAVTLGSHLERRAARAAEAAAACHVLGFDGVLPVMDGFSDVHETTRARDPVAWRAKVARIADMIGALQPDAVFLPHADDAHAAHIGTHYLGMDALALLSRDFTCAVFQTEFWRPHPAPNLMIGIGVDDAACLIDALACHVGENARNPYDARFPAYLIDTVRRGGEIVGGKGAKAPAIDFAMLYYYGIWKNGSFIPSALKRVVPSDQSLDDILL